MVRFTSSCWRDPRTKKGVLGGERQCLSVCASFWWGTCTGFFFSDVGRHWFGVVCRLRAEYMQRWISLRRGLFFVLYVQVSGGGCAVGRVAGEAVARCGCCPCLWRVRNQASCAMAGSRLTAPGRTHVLGVAQALGLNTGFKTDHVPQRRNHGFTQGQIPGSTRHGRSQVQGPIPLPSAAPGKLQAQLPIPYFWNDSSLQRLFPNRRLHAPWPISVSNAAPLRCFGRTVRRGPRRLCVYQRLLASMSAYQRQACLFACLFLTVG
jgi:hypothetical protein